MRVTLSRRNFFYYLVLAALILCIIVLYSFNALLHQKLNKLISANITTVTSRSSTTTNRRFANDNDEEEAICGPSSAASSLRQLRRCVEHLRRQLDTCFLPLPSSVAPLSKSKDVDWSGMRNETDVQAYSAFTNAHLFPFYKHNVVKLAGSTLADTSKVIQTALAHLNRHTANHVDSSLVYTPNDLAIGFYRATPALGYEYELTFRAKESPPSLVVVKLVRPLLPLTVDTSSAQQQAASGPLRPTTIHIIVPFADNSDDGMHRDAMRRFLLTFEAVVAPLSHSPALRERVALQIVCAVSKNNSLATIAWLSAQLTQLKVRTGFQAIDATYVPDAGGERFSRAKLLSLGAAKYAHHDDDPLMFFCDVDVMFDANFLELCGAHAKRGEQVFFPILFSLYKKASREQVTDHGDNLAGVKLRISDETGYWRDSGFGMTCLFKSDFERVDGFLDTRQRQRQNCTRRERMQQDEQLIDRGGWGGEDVHLYRKFVELSNVARKFRVFRAIVPGLFHIYHAKECNSSEMTPVTYRDCVLVKVMSEASHKQYGLDYFNITNIKP